LRKDKKQKKDRILSNSVSGIKEQKPEEITPKLQKQVDTLVNSYVPTWMCKYDNSSNRVDLQLDT
jgi:hypothetical protein